MSGSRDRREEEILEAFEFYTGIEKEKNEATRRARIKQEISNFASITKIVGVISSTRHLLPKCFEILKSEISAALKEAEQLGEHGKEYANVYRTCLHDELEKPFVVPGTSSTPPKKTPEAEEMLSEEVQTAKALLLSVGINDELKEENVETALKEVGKLIVNTEDPKQQAILGRAYLDIISKIAKDAAYIHEKMIDIFIQLAKPSTHKHKSVYKFHISKFASGLHPSFESFLKSLKSTPLSIALKRIYLGVVQEVPDVAREIERILSNSTTTSFSTSSTRFISTVATTCTSSPSSESAISKVTSIPFSPNPGSLSTLTWFASLPRELEKKPLVSESKMTLR